jgi:hypothetical protein
MIHITPIITPCKRSGEPFAGEFTMRVGVQPSPAEPEVSR